MKTLAELQAAVDEIRGVCRKHGIVLNGTCEGEQIYAEIAVAENKAEAIHWREPKEHLSNEVEESRYVNDFIVDGIGDLEEAEGRS